MYRSEGVTEVVKEIVVKWAPEGRDSKVFVEKTLVTEENLEAVLMMMAVGVGKDVFVVKTGLNHGDGSESRGGVEDDGYWD
jgi:hypothetical protein